MMKTRARVNEWCAAGLIYIARVSVLVKINRTVFQKYTIFVFARINVAEEYEEKFTAGVESKLILTQIGPSIMAFREIIRVKNGSLYLCKKAGQFYSELNFKISCKILGIIFVQTAY